MNIKVRKLTCVELLREANSFTTNKESKMSLQTAYRLKHSPIRTQIFWIEMRDIPLFVASQLVRSHVGIQCFQLSKRTDRGGASLVEECAGWVEGLERVESGQNEDVMEMISLVKEEFKTLPERFDRYAPTDLAMLINAEAIMNMSAKRLCAKASKETREIWQHALDLIEEVDPDLVKFCKKPCVLSGVCRESKSCGYMASESYLTERRLYKNLFKAALARNPTGL